MEQWVASLVAKAWLPKRVALKVYLSFSSKKLPIELVKLMDGKFGKLSKQGYWDHIHWRTGSRERQSYINIFETISSHTTQHLFKGMIHEFSNI